MTTRAMVMAVVGLVAGGCEADSGQRAREAGALAERTRVGAGELVSAAGERTSQAAQAAGVWAGEQLRSGELSESARGWLRRGAEASRGGIEALLQRGEQAVPGALEIGRALAAAIDADTTFEPIYQQVSGATPELVARHAEVDAVIKDMPRVEVIEGLQVGFKDLSRLDLDRQVSDQAYLVVWRQEDRLIGFIYRSRRGIALAQLVALAPRLIGLVRAAL